MGDMVTEGAHHHVPGGHPAGHSVAGMEVALRLHVCLSTLQLYGSCIMIPTFDFL